MKYFLLTVFGFLIIGCQVQATNPNTLVKVNGPIPYLSNEDSIKVTTYYEVNKRKKLPSKSIGSVSKGRLENGKLMPFFGHNFSYFDVDSYLNARAYTNEKVSQIILDSYSELANDIPNRHFYLMELSNQNGGKMFPHKTHQNGLSVDFMMPKLKNGAPYYALDTLGKDHYWLQFNDNGEYSKDTIVKIDFNLISKHILILQEKAKVYGYRIAKVIIKIEYKDELLASNYGKELKKSGIYIVKSLTPLINELHDDHYHIDFEKI